MLPIFVETATKLNSKINNLKILIPAIDSDIYSLIENIIQESSLDFRIFMQQEIDVILASEAVLLSSGTATFETMLLEKPMLVSYKVSSITGFIAKRLVQTIHFSLPNLLANDTIVPEYIQGEINTDKMADELYKMIKNPQVRKDMIKKLARVKRFTKKDGANIAARAIFDKFSTQNFM